jgi:hypothetical protein
MSSISGRHHSEGSSGIAACVTASDKLQPLINLRKLWTGVITTNLTLSAISFHKVEGPKLN